MRIAFVCLCRFGGTLHCGRQLAYALTRIDGIDLMYVGSRNASYAPNDGLDRANIPRLLVRSGRGKLANLFQSVNSLNFSMIGHRVRQFAPDVVHFATTHAWHFMLIPMLRRYASVSTIHDPFRHLGAESRFYAGLTGFETALADRVIVLSHAQRGALQRFGKPESKVDVVPHGELGSGRKFRDVPGQGKILFFGRFEPYKGMDLLVDAFRTVKRKRPELSLLLAGRGDLTPKLTTLEATEGIQVCNRWLSEEEVNQLCIESDLVVLPYLEATQSGVVAKAQALGRPVIVTDVGGLSEQVEHGTTGLVVPPNDVVALAEAIERVLQAPDQISQMAQAAWDLYHKRYAWSTIAAQTVEVYRRAREDRLSSGRTGALAGIKAAWVGIRSGR